MSKQTQQTGFTLISVLVSILVFAVGMLSLAGVYARMISATTQNQNLTQLVGLSNGFLGAIQAQPNMLASIAGTYTSANIGAAPAGLQDWLTTATTQLPAGASITIQTGPDAAGADAACDMNNGCVITLIVSWTQNANGKVITNGTATRTQVFTYQYPLQ